MLRVVDVTDARTDKTYSTVCCVVQGSSFDSAPKVSKMSSHHLLMRFHPLLTTAPSLVSYYGPSGLVKYSLLKITSIKSENIPNKLPIDIVLSLYFLHLSSVRIPNRIPSSGCVQ
jgi:hypothetical protein